MTTTHRTLPRLFGLAVAGALTLSACGSTSTSTTASTTTAAPTTTTAAAPGTTAKPAADGKAALQVVDTPYGKAIGRGDGHVLYTWDKEAAAGNTAVCVEAKCLDKWPPLLAASFSVGAGLDEKAFSLVDRPDGTKQVAYGGQRLYAMAADEAGDANCQGVEGWWILNPDGTKNTTPA